MNPTLKDDDELIQILRSSADFIYAYFESLGSEPAKKARELRAINARIIKAASEVALPVGYYRRFEKPLDAAVVYLFSAGSPVDRGSVLKGILAGGFIGVSRSGPYKAVFDSLDHQTKEFNNGRLKIEDIGGGMLRLTSEGKKDAADLIKDYGSPDI